jgi:hypothetical protein
MHGKCNVKLLSYVYFKFKILNLFSFSFSKINFKDGCNLLVLFSIIYAFVLSE